mmetsp:Transcript_61729/g.130278  ORF Transcript_61729/g.130278 Transcript_61729/m.130278 type:complete len:260 (-) Transcript_61729:683-1462(-)
MASPVSKLPCEAATGRTAPPLAVPGAAGVRGCGSNPIFFKNSRFLASASALSRASLASYCSCSDFRHSASALSDSAIRFLAASMPGAGGVAIPAGVAGTVATLLTPPIIITGVSSAPVLATTFGVGVGGALPGRGVAGSGILLVPLGVMGAAKFGRGVWGFEIPGAGVWGTAAPPKGVWGTAPDLGVPGTAPDLGVAGTAPGVLGAGSLPCPIWANCMFAAVRGVWGTAMFTESDRFSSNCLACSVSSSSIHRWRFTSF